VQSRGGVGTRNGKKNFLGRLGEKIYSGIEANKQTKTNRMIPSTGFLDVFFSF
jgi:hypothetical protein